MLALLALFGALSAGLVADAIITGQKDTSEGDSDDTENSDGSGQTDAEDESGTENMLDYVEPILTDAQDASDAILGGFASGYVEDGMPVSDDIANPVDEAETLTGGADDDILSGHDNDDDILGGEGDDLLTGRGGDDLMLGGSGRDHLDGGEGDDILKGQGGDDRLVGGAGDDSLVGGMGQDSLAGQEGDDHLSGGSGADTLQGGDGNDSLSGGMGRDWLAGGSGNDLVEGGASQDTLDGGTGDDTLWGASATRADASVDFLNGGAGDDVLHLGSGDIAMGAEGADSFVLHDVTAGSTMTEISDYDPAEDEIVVMYDPGLHASPQLSAQPIGDSDDVTLMLDGVAVAIVKGGIGMDLSQVTLRAA